MHTKALLLTSFFGAAFFSTVLLFKSDPDDFVALDALSRHAVLPFQSFTPSEFFIALTTLGGATGIMLVAIGVAVLLRRERMLILRLSFALIASGLSVMAGKMLIARVRPDGLPWLTQMHSYSFPSGHTASSTVLYGFIALLLYCRVRNPLVRNSVIALLLVLIASIGISRIVLAVHYGSDVLAGFFLGGCSLSLMFVYPLTPKERIYLGKQR